MTIDDYLAAFLSSGWRLDHICSTTNPGNWIIRIVPLTPNGDQINTFARTIKMALADALDRLSRGDVYNPGRRIVHTDPDLGPVSTEAMPDLSALLPKLWRR